MQTISNNYCRRPCYGRRDHAYIQIQSSSSGSEDSVRTLTRPSQLLIATDAPGTSVMSPIKLQSVLSNSLLRILSVWVSFSVPLPGTKTSSCHSTMAPGATSRLLGQSRRWNSLPKAVTLKKSFSPAGSVAKGTLRLTRCLWFAERRCDKKWPPESVLIGVTRPYSFSRLFKKSDEMAERKSASGQKSNLLK